MAFDLFGRIGIDGAATKANFKKEATSIASSFKENFRNALLGGGAFIGIQRAFRAAIDINQLARELKLPASELLSLRDAANAVGVSFDTVTSKLREAMGDQTVADIRKVRKELEQMGASPHGAALSSVEAGTTAAKQAGRSLRNFLATGFGKAQSILDFYVTLGRTGSIEAAREVGLETLFGNPSAEAERRAELIERLKALENEEPEQQKRTFDKIRLGGVPLTALQRSGAFIARGAGMQEVIEIERKQLDKLESIDRKIGGAETGDGSGVKF